MTIRLSSATFFRFAIVGLALLFFQAPDQLRAQTQPCTNPKSVSEAGDRYRAYAGCVLPRSQVAIVNLRELAPRSSTAGPRITFRSNCCPDVTSLHSFRSTGETLEYKTPKQCLMRRLERRTSLFGGSRLWERHLWGRRV